MDLTCSVFSSSRPQKLKQALQVTEHHGFWNEVESRNSRGESHFEATGVQLTRLFKEMLCKVTFWP
jgi:hypothetical protein